MPGTNTVTFGGIAANNVSVVDDVSLTCDTPPGAAGSTVDVADASYTNDIGDVQLSAIWTDGSAWRQAG